MRGERSGENPPHPRPRGPPIAGTHLPFRHQRNYLRSMNASFSVSDRAAARIAEIVAAEGKPAALRVSVLAGGCSGFQYRFELDETARPDDVVVEAGDARVLVDPASLDLLGGAQLDYTEALMAAHFTVRNPNATSACGCGTSFSID